MKNPTRTAVRELIERLQGAVSVETAEKAFYDMLELERQIIAQAYEAAMANISQGVSMDGLEYYDTTFDNQ
jgi:hypothetical protein